MSAQPLAQSQPLRAPEPGSAIDNIAPAVAERAPTNEAPPPVELPRVRPAPRMPARTLAMGAAPGGVEAARYRQLRARLRRCGDPHVIGVQGSGARVAASTAAANLALAFAECGRRVVVIDAGGHLAAALGGLRAPSPLRPPFPSGYEAERFRLVHFAPRVDVLLGPRSSPFAGNGDDEPEGGEAHERLVRLSESLREDYDYVIVNLAPRASLAAGPVAGLEAVLLVDDCHPTRVDIAG